MAIPPTLPRFGFVLAAFEIVDGVVTADEPSDIDSNVGDGIRILCVIDLEFEDARGDRVGTKLSARYERMCGPALREEFERCQVERAARPFWSIRHGSDADVAAVVVVRLRSLHGSLE